MTTPLSPQAPKLPSRKVGALLATAMLAVGIALGALIGPGPTNSLASSSRAAAIGRVLALLALGSGTGSGGNLALSSGAANPPASTPQPTPSRTSETTSGSTKASGGAESASSTLSHSSPSSRTTSPTSSTTPAAGGGEESEKTSKAKPLPPIADAWVIELPYGTSLENALKQSTAAPYLDGQLKDEGTVLGGYTSLAAAQLAGAATLLSGQVSASVNTIAPPPCTSAAAGATPGATGSAAGTPTSSTSQPAAVCPSGEPAGVHAADAYLQEVVPKIEASTAYKEHGLIVITFGAAGRSGETLASGENPPSGQQEAPSGTTTSPPAGANAGAGTEVAYPAGSITSTLTTAGAPAGALLLSPFLSHAGARSTSAFNPLAPHESLEALFRAKASS